MASIPAVVIDGQTLLDIIAGVVWTAIRIGGVLMVAPLFGTRMVPARVKVLLSIVLGYALMPFSGKPPADIGIDPQTALLVAREIGIGLAMGFVLRMAFEAGALAGELIAQGTGLSFATLADPIRGTSSGVLAQWFNLAFGLLFLALDGHLGLVEMIAASFRNLPLNGEFSEMAGLLQAVPAYFSLVLRVGVQLALPVMLSMLVVNLAFGVLSRAASALNPIQLGLPVSVLLGLVLLVSTARELLVPVQALFDAAFATAIGLTGVGL